MDIGITLINWYINRSRGKVFVEVVIRLDPLVVVNDDEISLNWYPYSNS